MGGRRRKNTGPDPFLKHYRARNAADLRAKVDLAEISPQKRRKLMRRIRKRNRPILDLARRVYPSLRRYALARDPRNCILGTEERIVRDVWDICVAWAQNNS